MPALGISLDRTAHARHAAARRTGRTKSPGLCARAARRMAGRSGRGPSHRDRRCRDHGAHFHRPASQAARPRHPHARARQNRPAGVSPPRSMPNIAPDGSNRQPRRSSAQIVSAPARIETYPYRHRVRAVMTSPAQFIDAHAALSEALARMAREQMSSLFVRFEDGPFDRPGSTGIVTERDVMRALAGRAARRLRSRSRRLPAVRSKPCRPMRSCTAPSGV